MSTDYEIMIIGNSNARMFPDIQQVEMIEAWLYERYNESNGWRTFPHLELLKTRRGLEASLIWYCPYVKDLWLGDFLDFCRSLPIPSDDFKILIGINNDAMELWIDQYGLHPPRGYEAYAK